MSNVVDPFTVAVIIPTGVAASIGGFGGDGMTLLPMLADIADWVITHPNVANAACFQRLPENTLYVEGLGLDRYFRGDWALRPVRQNRVGVIWDAGIPTDMFTLHLNTIEAVKTVYGVHVTGLQETAKPVNITSTIEASGRSSGHLQNPHVLFDAAENLIKEGAQALAVCCLMPEGEDEDEKAIETAYKTGAGVDPIAGLEAMISHLLVDRYQIPVAHAPVFDWDRAHPVMYQSVDPRSASEFIVSTFLPCALTGLGHGAPQFIPNTPAMLGQNDLTIEHLNALIVPVDALGSVPVFACLERGIPVITIANNQTVMQANRHQLGLSTANQLIYPCANYMEALGILHSLKHGTAIPPHIWSPAQATPIQVHLPH